MDLVVPEKLKPDVVVGGIDWGGMGDGRDPIALEIGVRTIDRGDPRWFNIDELYVGELVLDDFYAAVGTFGGKYRVQRWWCGQEQYWAVLQLAGRGVPALVNHVTGAGSLDFGLRTLYNLARQGRWANNPRRCPRLQDEFTQFKYAMDRAGQPTGKPRDEHDHGISAVRYYLTGEGETPPHLTEPPPLEQQPTILRGPDGQLYDNPNATVAQRALKYEDRMFGLAPLWDEREQKPDEDGELRKVWRYLTGKEAPWPARKEN